MTWTGTAQTALDAGQAVELTTLVHVKARSFSDGSTVPLGLWTGAEPLALVVEGEARLYQPVGAALSVSDRQSAEGLIVKRAQVTLEGVNDQVNNLRVLYDIAQAPADGHMLLRAMGSGVLGTKRIFSGNIDAGSFTLNDTAGSLSLDVVSLIRKGTRIPARLRDEVRDPMFKFAHITDGDVWG